MIALLEMGDIVY